MNRKKSTHATNFTDLQEVNLKGTDSCRSVRGPGEFPLPAWAVFIREDPRPIAFFL